MSNGSLLLILGVAALLAIWIVVASVTYAVVSRFKSREWIGDHLKVYSVVLGGVMAPAILSGGHAFFPVPGGAAPLGILALFAFDSDGPPIFLINTASWLVVSVFVYLFTSSRLKRDAAPSSE